MSAFYAAALAAYFVVGVSVGTVVYAAVRWWTRRKPDQSAHFAATAPIQEPRRPPGDRLDEVYRSGGE